MELMVPPRSLGQEKQASVLFVDIADYTAFSEQTPAYYVVHVLNRYFYIAGTIIKEIPWPNHRLLR